MISILPRFAITSNEFSLCGGRSHSTFVSYLRISSISGDWARGGCDFAYSAIGIPVIG